MGGVILDLAPTLIQSLYLLVLQKRAAAHLKVFIFFFSESFMSVSWLYEYIQTGWSTAIGNKAPRKLERYPYSN